MNFKGGDRERIKKMRESAQNYEINKSLYGFKT